MLRMDQIQRELKAIVEFDRLFLKQAEQHPEEIAGYECRILRKLELIALVESIASRN